MRAQWHLLQALGIDTLEQLQAAAHVASPEMERSSVSMSMRS